MRHELAKENMTGQIIRRLWFPVALLMLVIITLPTMTLFVWHFSTLSHLVLFTACQILVFFILLWYCIAVILKEEKNLLHSEKLSRVLVENRKDYAIFLLDPKGIITSWNNGAERLFGYAEKEVLGKSFTYLLAESDQYTESPMELLRQIEMAKQMEYQCWLNKKNHVRFWGTLTVAAIFDEDNHLIGFTKLVRDSTRQKEMDDKLKELLMSLERSNKELENFAYIASHDLQEPLRMISSYTKLLATKYKGKLDQEADEYIEFAVDGAVRMQNLITDLLAFSRVTINGKPIEPLSCNEILKKTLRNLSVYIAESKAEITYDNLPDVMGDEVQLIQVFQNLISNAIKFHSAALPRIHISAEKKGQHIIFKVMDNGIGIEPKFHEKIFSIFLRLHSRQEIPGAGIGLAICKKIVERHGGKIWVESEPGRGATFFFTLLQSRR